MAERTHHHVEIPAVLAARAVCDVDNGEEALVVALGSGESASQQPWQDSGLERPRGRCLGAGPESPKSCSRTYDRVLAEGLAAVAVERSFERHRVVLEAKRARWGSASERPRLEAQGKFSFRSTRAL